MGQGKVRCCCHHHASASVQVIHPPTPGDETQPDAPLGQQASLPYAPETSLDRACEVEADNVTHREKCGATLHSTELETCYNDTVQAAGGSSLLGEGHTIVHKRDPSAWEGAQDAPSVFDSLRSINSARSVNSLHSYSGFSEQEYEEMSREQRKEARHLVKDFVRMMVRGRSFPVVTASGEHRNCFCTLSRKLDKLKISLSEKDPQTREIPLAGIMEILAGVPGVGGIVKELGSEDELCVTLLLDSNECITFCLPDAEARDKLVMCLTMFSNQARQAIRS